MRQKEEKTDLEAQEKYNIFNKSLVKTLVFCVFLLLSTLFVFHSTNDWRILASFIVVLGVLSVAFIRNRLRDFILYSVYFMFTFYICIVGFAYFVRALKDIESVSFVCLVIAGSIYALTIFDKKLKILYSLVFMIANALLVSLILSIVPAIVASILEIVLFLLCRIIIKKIQEKKREDIL